MFLDIFQLESLEKVCTNIYQVLLIVLWFLQGYFMGFAGNNNFF